jgi:hypothetical protein
VLFDPSGVLPRGFDLVATEIRAVFRSLGIETTWRVGGGYGESELPEVPVIVLARDPLRTRRGVMGLVVPDQRPQRAVWIFEEGVRAVVAPAAKRRSFDAPHVLDRALARVAAHEIIHAIAPDVEHAQSGLMRHALGRDFLLGAKAPVDARCAAAFRTGLSLEWQRRLGQVRAAVIGPGQ